ncbi:MAG: helix-turn-helix domain-containing protein [Nanoarchaeota archaeon]
MDKEGRAAVASMPAEELKRFLETALTEEQTKLLLQVNVPLSIFSTAVCPLEALAKYLVDDRGMPLSRAASLLQRAPATLSVALKNGRKKLPLKLPAESAYFLPAEAFADQKLSILELVAIHLRAAGLSFADIGRFLHRDERTIWTACDRGRRKHA